ncbi:MAG: glycosyltransferase [Elusimicrobiota bacterium]
MNIDFKRYKIAVATVTYGNRWHLLSQVLYSIKDNDLVGDIIVVDNGSEEDITSLVKNLKSNKIKVIKTGKNLGSAGGFYIAIKTAYENSKCDFIFLLDDDNIVEKGCLEDLLNIYMKLGNNKNNCLKAYKYNNKSEIILSKYSNLLDLENSFFNFHFKKKIFIKKYKNKSKIISVNGVAYSGFFFHKSILCEIGFPEEKMVLYNDDTEYTLRFKYNGKRIFLCKNCRLRDLEKSWHHNLKNINPFFYTKTNLIRSMYGIRNRAYIEKKYLVKNKFIYFFNFIAYFIYNAIKAYFFLERNRESIKKIHIFLKLVIEGWRGEFKTKIDLNNINL